jgi:hypothetical protein
MRVGSYALLQKQPLNYSVNLPRSQALSESCGGKTLGRSWSRDLLKSSRFSVDDDGVDKYLIFIL